MIVFEDTLFDGVKIIKTQNLKDERGFFSKLQNSDLYGNAGLGKYVQEIYISKSQKGVVRGLHLQNPPFAQSKIVFCLTGSIFDVAVDIRKKSPTFGKHFSIRLDADNPVGIYVPEGFAHGLQALDDNTLILNACSAVYRPETEVGIAWNSCSINWPIDDAIVSAKDQDQPKLDDFNSEF